MILGIDCGPFTLGSSGGIVQHVHGILLAYAHAFRQDRILVFLPDQLDLKLPSSENIKVYKEERKTLVKVMTETLRSEAADILVRGFPSLHSPDFPPDRQIVIIPDMQHADH